MLVKSAFIVAAAALVALALSGPGTRWGWWDFRIGLLLFALSGILGLVAVIVGFFTRRKAKGDPIAARVGAAAIIGGLLAMTPLVYGIVAARRAAPIHDVTSDVAQPPRFRAVLPARANGANPAPDRIDPAVAARQRAAYPDIQPLVLKQPPEEAFRRAVATARSLHWEILVADAANGTIEATARTPWFGFHDDIAIRVLPAAGGGSRVDIRSTSRVGRSDLGANAYRIRQFLRLMD